jgi:hypothetical protein
LFRSPSAKLAALHHRDACKARRFSGHTIEYADDAYYIACAQTTDRHGALCFTPFLPSAKEGSNGGATHDLTFRVLQ